MPTRTELNELYAAAHKLKQVTEERDALLKELATLKNQEPIGYAMKYISTGCKSSCDTCKHTWGNPGNPGAISANPGDCYMFYAKPQGVCIKWASWLRDDDDEVSTPACHAAGAKEKTE